MGHRVESSWPPKFRSRQNLHFGDCNVKCFLGFLAVVPPTTRETLQFEPHLEDRSKYFVRNYSAVTTRIWLECSFGFHFNRRSRHEN
jgi:hypothetical protein